MNRENHERCSAETELDQAFEIAGRHFQNCRHEEAKQIYEGILQSYPHHPRALHALGVVTYHCGNVAAAIALIERSIEVKPDFADALNNLGNILRFQGKPKKAKLAYERALAINPGLAEASYNLGNYYSSHRKFSKAAAFFKKAIEIRPAYALAHNNLGLALINHLKLDEALESYKRALDIEPESGSIHSNLLYAMQYSPRYTAESIYHESLSWQNRRAERSLSRNTHHEDRNSAKKLRVGYVSADLGRHPIGYFLSPVLAAHDRDSIEIFCYSGKKDEDDLSSRMKNDADNWRSTVNIDDDSLIDMITADRIDILVDLSGHTGGNRLDIFARKPAPVQATWAGYVGTTGISAMDYLISDWQESPEGSEQWCVEKVIRLPECYVCYEPPEYAPLVSSLPAEINGYVTFGCFNNLAKINEDVLALWKRILREIPDTHLLLIAPGMTDPAIRTLLRKKFGDLRNRVHLSGFLRHEELLAAYGRVDIALDPFPYSGGLTTLESLWMGVPVVTLGGERFASRHSLSHLTAVGLPELVADGPDAYVAKVSSLASDLVKLADLRRNLRALMAASPLCDAVRFTRNLEAAFREMWLGWCNTADASRRSSKAALRVEKTAEEQIEKLFESAEMRMGQERLQLADSIYRQVLRLKEDSPRALHALGIIASRHGNSGQAERFFRQAIGVSPGLAEVHRHLGDLLKEIGKTDEAMASYFNAISVDPHSAEAHFDLGNLLTDLAKPLEALECFRKALEVKPDYPEALCNMGVLYTNLDRPEEAIATYRKAIQVDKDFVSAYNNLANVLLDQGNQEEALACYRQAVHINPGFSEGFFNLGNVLAKLGDNEEAKHCYRKAIRISPGFPEPYNNLGNLLREQGSLDESITILKHAIRLKPTFAEAHNNLGVAFKERGDIEDAVDSFRQAIGSDRSSAEPLSNLGDVLCTLGRLDEAVDCCRKAIELKGDFFDAYNNLGNALIKQGKLAEAQASYEMMLTIHDHSAVAAVAYNNLGTALTAQGRLAECLASYRQALALKADYPEAHSNLLFAMNYSPLCSARQIFEESVRYNQIHAAPGADRRKPHTNNRDKNRRLRIGYVSPDLRKHSISYFCEPLLASHDREEVEIFCYADVIKPDETTFRLQTMVNSWHYTKGMTNEALAEKIRNDRIDILVDLSGHTAGNRLAVFAEKPAPIQVSWLGYPNTTGMSAIDYRLTDAVADPIGMSGHIHSETLIRLPEGFLCYLPPPEAPQVHTLPATEKGYITFGSFNNLAKMTDSVVELWGKLLAGLPGSRLVLKNNSFADEATRIRYLEMLKLCGIEPSRVTMLSMTATTRSHLDLYGQIDLALDPFPYNGTTTTCEALWMGVPVITLLGDRHAGRVGASILQQLKLDGLVATTPGDYIRIAMELANDLEQLGNLRHTLRKRMMASPLCDAHAFARAMEAAFREVWQKWCDCNSN